MSEETHAYLPSYAIERACVYTIDEIGTAREQILSDIIKPYRRRAALLPRRTVKHAKSLVPKAHLEIPGKHRLPEEGRVIQVRDLARAVAEENEDFRVYISVGDFAYIRTHYYHEDD